jgi:type IV secretion system protein VirB4
MLRDPSDDLAMLPDWARKERPMASMLPYVQQSEARHRGSSFGQAT